MMEKRKETNPETMETVFVLYGNIYIIMNDNNNNKKEFDLDLEMKIFKNVIIG